MEISKKHIFLLIFGFVLYGYLTDLFQRPDFSEKIIHMVAKATRNKTHSFISFIKERTNLFASTISISCTTILGCLPVRVFFLVSLFSYLY